MARELRHCIKVGVYRVDIHNRSITHKPSGSKIRCDFLGGAAGDWTIDQNYSTKAAKIRNSHGLSQQLAGLFLAKGIHLPKMGGKTATAARGSSRDSASEASAASSTVQEAPASITQTSTAPGAKWKLTRGSDGKFRLRGSSAAELQETEAKQKKHSLHNSEVGGAATAQAPRPAKTKAPRAPADDDECDSEASDLPATPMPQSRKVRRALCAAAPTRGSPSAPPSTEKQSRPEAHTRAPGFAKPGYQGKSKQLSHPEISERRTSRHSHRRDKDNNCSRSRSHSQGRSQGHILSRSPSRSRSHSNNSHPGSPHAHPRGPQLLHSPVASRVYGTCAKSKPKPLRSKARQPTAATHTRKKGEVRDFRSDADLDIEENNNSYANNNEGVSEDDAGWPIES